MRLRVRDTLGALGSRRGGAGLSAAVSSGRTTGGQPQIRRFGLTLATTTVVLLAAVPDLALAQPPAPIYVGERLRDCVTGNNQLWSAVDQKFHWWVNQDPGRDRSRGASGKCDSHENDSYERPTDQTFRDNRINQKPAGAGPPFEYSPPANPGSPVFLSGLAPDAELSQGQLAFSTEAGPREAGRYFEFLDITRGRSGFIVDGQTLGTALRNGLRRNVRCPAACRIQVTVAVGEVTARRTGLGTGRTIVARGELSLDSAGRRTTFVQFAARGQAAPGRAHAGSRSWSDNESRSGGGPERSTAWSRSATAGCSSRSSCSARQRSRPTSSGCSRSGFGGAPCARSRTARTTPFGSGTTRTRTGPTTGSRSATSSGMTRRALRAGRRLEHGEGLQRLRRIRQRRRRGQRAETTRYRRGTATTSIGETTAGSTSAKWT